MLHVARVARFRPVDRDPDDVIAVGFVVDRHGRNVPPNLTPASPPREDATGWQDARPTALVTAPFRGEGMDTLQSLADVVYDPWIEQVPLRLSTARSSRRAVARARRRHPRRRVRLRERPRVRVRPRASSARAAATPTTSTSPPRPRPASRCSTRPAATPTPSPRSRSRCSSRSTASSCPPTATCAPARCTPSGKIPYQRYRAWQLAGRTAGIVGLGAVGRATQWRLQGPRHARARVRPVQPGRDPHVDLDEMLPECDVVSMHAVVDARDRGPHGRRRSSRA